MDPVCCKVDLKRLLIDKRTIIDFDSPIFNINCTIDKILINFGQKDFGTLYFTWSCNLKKILSLCRKYFIVEQNIITLGIAYILCINEICWT